MDYCTRCGHPAGDAAEFCVSCGAPLATDEDQGWAAVPPGPGQGGGVRTFGDTSPRPDGNVRIFGDRPLEQTGNVRIVGGPAAAGEAPAGEAPAGRGGPVWPGPGTPGEPPASYGGPGFPGAGGPGREPEPASDPGEDTAAWLPGFTAAAAAPVPVLALRPPARPVRADPSPPRHPLNLPPPAGGDGPGGDDGLYPADPAAGQPPDPGGQVPAWLKIAVLLMVIAGGLGAWYYLGRPSVAARPASSAGRTPGTPRAQATRPSPHRPSGPAGRSRPAGTPRGSRPVALGPGVAGQGAAAGVAGFLTQYFAAINDHDYQVFSSLFEPGASPVQSDAEFRSGYRTSRDSGGRLVALGQTAGGEWAASLTFDSHQDPAGSATHTACTAWRVTFYLVPVGDSYLIGPPPPGYQASASPCA